MTSRRFATLMAFMVTMFTAGFAAGGPAWWVPGGGGGSTVSPSGSAAAGEVTYWTSPTAISGNTLMTYTAGTGVFALNTNGTAGAPVLTMGTPADPNTGFFHPAADALAWSTSGVERVRTISTGEVGIGCTNPQSLIDASSDTSAVSLVENFNASSYGVFEILRGRGTRASPTAVQSGDHLGAISIGGQYDTTFGHENGAATIDAYASETWTSTANGANLVLSTPTNGTTYNGSPANAVRLTIAGATGDITSGNATHTSDFLPFADNTGQLGTLSQRWQLIAGATVHSGDLHLEDPERGAHWVMREETDGITLINERTGKRFRMAMVPEETAEAESLWHHACRSVGMCQ